MASLVEWRTDTDDEVERESPLPPPLPLLPSLPPPLPPPPPPTPRVISPPPSPAATEDDDEDGDDEDGDGDDEDGDDEDGDDEDGGDDGRARRLLGAQRHLARRRTERNDPFGTVTIGYLTELYSSPRFMALGPEVRGPFFAAALCRRVVGARRAGAGG